MQVAERVAALLETLSTVDLERMQPAARRRFADRCRRVADLCDRLDGPRPNGVLGELQDVRREG
jgi:hypothetical protein